MICGTTNSPLSASGLHWEAGIDMFSTRLAMLLISVAACAGCGQSPQGAPTPARRNPDGPETAIAVGKSDDGPGAGAAARAAQSAYASSVGISSLIENNSIDMELVLIPPGRFTMGVPASDKEAFRDESQVDVLLTNGFSLGKTEVTQRQWRAVMGTTPWQGELLVREGDNCPATFVSWEDAQMFCRKLSELEHRAYRSWSRPDLGGHNIGFRVARSINP
jgi:formylglycine-generating enzyme required for sulfatase activity